MEEMQKEIASISKEESEITSLSGDGRKIVPDFERNNDYLKQYDLNENDSSTMETTAAKKPKTVLKMTTSPLHYNTIGSYLAAKQEETELKYRPVWDSSPQCMMRDTVQIRTALSKMEERTQRKNAEHENRRTQINKMIQDLRSDQEQLTEHLIKYSEFLDENAEKKQRSKEIIAREEELSKDLDEQIAFAEEEVRKATEKRDRMKRVISSKQKFVDFLEKVVSEKPVEFSRGIDDVENRYKLLQGIVMGAIEGKKVFVERIQVEGARYAKQLNEYKSQIIDKNNLITSLSVRSDTAQKELRYWTGIVDKVDQQTETSMSDLQSVKDACWNMYVQMCDHSGRPVTLTEDQTIKQLNHIVKEILDKRRLINIFKRLQTSDITSKPSKTKQPAKNN
ncbi:uveal autoantigen with coiled-coil domains and ankyrin repeats protein isoform X2 [Nilaparvata lugens]|uniref:uveal autoantigen with coiled-coil domains and ankyrin repeats protein isoform X2 n=1 Tax=Nilaparvata lugens TaxID=108931 RepID=UPI00193DF9A2|nr:uveal autoantigen with coiled-coil domains and ankyrin repeats protein isoform X2 [Nilaparvata lugens]